MAGPGGRRAARSCYWSARQTRMEALRYYELERPEIVSTFASERNDNVVVEDRGGKRLVVRRFRRNLDRERIAFQLDVQEHLAARRVPTPAIVLTRFREYESQRPLTSHERDALPSLLALMFAPRIEKCELLAAEGENPSAWAASRVDAMAVLSGRQHELRTSSI